MRVKLENKKYPYAFLYVYMTFLCLMMVLVYTCIHGGGVLSMWLFDDIWDTGNDFFNCIPAVKGYGLGSWLIRMYPPLAKLFFLFFAHIYSYQNIPLDTAVRNSMTDPRMQQAALLPFMIFILFISITVIFLVSEIFREEKHVIAIGASIIGSYSILFAIERGNVIYLAIMLLMFFMTYYRSENRVLKEMALISLALSAGLKLYPAAFGILLLYQKQWKEAGRTIIYGLISLILPNIMINNYLEETGNMSNGIIEWVYICINNLFGNRPMLHRIFFIAAIAAGLLGTVAIGITSSKQWIRAFYAGILSMVCGVQFTYVYSYAFFLPAFILFLKEEKKITLKSLAYFVGMCIIHLPLPIFGTSKYARLPFVGEIKMWGLFAMIILIGLSEPPISKKVKEQKE